MTFVVVIRRDGFFASVNQRYHFALVGWWQIHWGTS